MSLELAAQHLATRGRKGDSMLVHMAPQEVAGLHALARAHGGALTVNPDTGLPEANFLKRLLPMIIGAGITAATGGAAAPWMIGLGLGGFETLRTGSLEKGLMAGLGAYGGAGLAGALMGAGAGAAGAGMGAAEAGASEMAATNAATQQNALTGIGVPSNAAAGTGSMSFAPNAGVNVLGTAPATAGPMSVPVTTGQLSAGVPQVATATPMPVAAPTFSQNLSQMGQGFKSLGTEAGRDAFMGQAASKGVEATGIGGMGGLAKYGLAAASPLMQPEAAEPYQGSGPNPYNFGFEWERPEDPRFDSREAVQLRGNLRPITRMKEGGETTKDAARGMTGSSADAMRYLMGQAAASPATQAARNYAAPAAPVSAPMPATVPAPSAGTAPVVAGAAQPGMEADPNIPFAFNFDPRTGQMVAAPRPMRPVTAVPDAQTDVNYVYAQGGIASLAQGGQSHLGDYSDGGRLLKGPGDGVSDSIPATIANKRPARLADGEFVVPARIVSELGNGSTEAGARKLYAMMDRIQKARGKTTGKNRVAVNSRAEKLLPA
jgi:hypothetical protein